MNIRQMEIFRAVMRAGSVTAASKALRISQPAVSAILRHCEDRLGAKLFFRVGRRLQPTPEAEALFPNIDRLFRQIETEMRAAQEVMSGTRGAISVAATHSFAPVVADVIPEFLSARGADLRISLQSLPSDEVVGRVLSHEVDFGVAYGPLHHGGIETEPFSASAVVCVMTKRYALSERGSIALADLMANRVITYGAHTALGKAIQSEMQRIGGRSDRRIEVNSTHLALMLADAGTGVALVDFMPQKARFSGLVVRPLTPRILVRSYLVFARGRPRSRLAADFVRHLVRGTSAERARWPRAC
jgi:DNA-binding transcriptional LysR family regulator